MTVDHAREHIGHRVRYQLGDYVNRGRITYAGRGEIYARLDGEEYPRLVNPGSLTLAENPR
jgi:hypothetical protein